MLQTLAGYQKAGYGLILSSHHTPEGQDAVAEKASYVRKVKELLAESRTADAFKTAMKRAFPDYAGENYLDMTADFLFPAGKTK